MFSMDFGLRWRNSTDGHTHMTQQHSNERVVQVHTADTATEAMVIRAMLQSAGIASPGNVSTDPFPLNEPPEGTHGVEIYALESQADEARRLIESQLKGRKHGAGKHSAD
jgi:hypothetical protein